MNQRNLLKVFSIKGFSIEVIYGKNHYGIIRKMAQKKKSKTPYH